MYLKLCLPYVTVLHLGKEKSSVFLRLYLLMSQLKRSEMYVDHFSTTLPLKCTAHIRPLCVPNCTWLLSLICFVFDPEHGFDLFYRKFLIISFWPFVFLSHASHLHFSAALSFFKGTFLKSPLLLTHFNIIITLSGKLCLPVSAHLAAPHVVGPRELVRYPPPQQQRSSHLKPLHSPVPPSIWRL